jgi:hypothetical protein
MILKNVDYYAGKKEYLTLKQEQMEMLKELLSKYMVPYINNKIPYCKMKRTSYGWKHIWEKICGFYISNIDFKEAMKQLGVINYVEQDLGCFPSINCCYAISESRVNFLEGFRDLFSGYKPFIYNHYKPNSKHYEDFTNEYNQLKDDVQFLLKKYNI